MILMFSSKSDKYSLIIHNEPTTFLKAKENIALISWVFSYYMNKYLIKTAVFNIFLAICGCWPIYYVPRDHRKPNERI